MKSSATIEATARKFSGTNYVRRLMAELDRAAICRRIAEARENAGLTQPELGEALDPPVHWRTVQSWERGENLKDGTHRWTVPWKRLDEIAQVTGTTKEALLHGGHAPAAAPASDAVTAETLERIEQQLEQLAQQLQQLVSQSAPRARPNRRGHS